MKKLFIISNESIYKSENKYFCDNLDMKSTPEGLSSYFEVNIVARKSKKPRFHEIDVKNIDSTTSIFSFLKKVIKTSKIENSKYLRNCLVYLLFPICWENLRAKTRLKIWNLKGGYRGSPPPGPCTPPFDL